MVKSNKRRDEERRAAAAVRVAEIRRAQQAAERRRRTLLVSAAAIAVIVIAVAAFVLVNSQHKAKTVAAVGVGGSTNSYGFVVGAAGAPASLVVYEDFQCPACKSFEDLDGATVDKYVADGKLKVEYRPIAFLDRMSSTAYSTRSLNAAACVTDHTDTKTFKKFHDLLYANQPAEGSAGLTDDQLITYARQAGATSPAVGTCIKDQTFKDWASSATDAASKAGVSATPTARLNGQDLPAGSLATVTAFSQALDAAAAKGTN